MKTTNADDCPFPMQYTDESPFSEGMTMREWYAGMALVGLSAYANTDPEYVLAQRCFTIADAMLSAARLCNAIRFGGRNGPESGLPKGSIPIFRPSCTPKWDAPRIALQSPAARRRPQ